MTLFDLIVGLALAASGLIGYVRGATREVTTVIALILAAMISVVGLRFTGPIAGHFIATPWMAHLAALLALFVAAYIVLRLIGGALTRGVQRTGLSGLDRTLGLAIGLVRGLIVIGAFMLLIDAATPPERMPAWIIRARLYPLADASGALLRAFAPQGWKLASDVAPRIGQAIVAAPTDSAAAGAPADRPKSPPGSDSGYTDSQRKALDVLVEKSR
jgi:membrane protein required for colicin V production